jgi:hypothetical protein
VRATALRAPLASDQIPDCAPPLEIVCAANATFPVAVMTGPTGVGCATDNWEKFVPAGAPGAGWPVKAMVRMAAWLVFTNPAAMAAASNRRVVIEAKILRCEYQYCHEQRADERCEP